MADLPQVLQLDTDAFGPLAYTAEIFEHFARENPELFLIYQHGTNIAGYIIGVQEPTSGYIASIAVRADVRRRGIGETLLRAVEERFELAQVSSLTLHVNAADLGAQRFWEQQGFQVYGTSPRYYPNGQTALQMQKPLVSDLDDAR